MYLAVARAIDLDFSVSGALYLVALTNFVAALPAAPGSIGTFDAAVAFGAKALGASGSAALSYVILLRFVLYVPITVRRARRAGHPLRRLVTTAVGGAPRGLARVSGPMSAISTGARRGETHPSRSGAGAPRHTDGADHRRLPCDLRPHAALPVHADLRPVGLDPLGPGDRAPRPGDRGRAVVEAVPDLLHGPVLVLRAGPGALPVAVGGARGRPARLRDGVPGGVPA